MRIAFASARLRVVVVIEAVNTSRRVDAVREVKSQKINRESHMTVEQTYQNSSDEDNGKVSEYQVNVNLLNLIIDGRSVFLS
jgi:hypothetical protein